MDIPHQSESSENGCLFFREDAPPPRAVVISFPDAWVRRQANLGMMGERQYKPAERPKVIRAAGGPGAPALVLESLPGDQTDEGQKDQEYAILEKFIAALRHFDGRDISGRYREGDGWPDFETGEGAGALGIEITSVTYEPHDDLERLEERYARRVYELLADALPQLAGLRFQHALATDPASELVVDLVEDLAHPERLSRRL
jgi:hypothetical protein